MLMSPQGAQLLGNADRHYLYVLYLAQVFVLRLTAWLYVSGWRCLRFPAAVCSPAMLLGMHKQLTQTPNMVAGRHTMLTTVTAAEDSAVYKMLWLMQWQLWMVRRHQQCLLPLPYRYTTCLRHIQGNNLLPAVAQKPRCRCKLTYGYDLS